MKKLLIFYFIILVTTPLFSQKMFLIKGKILDSRDSVIQFCQLQVKQLSTISNEEGEFELFIPEGQIIDTVAFSHFGFYTKKIAADNLIKNAYNTVILVEHAYDLNEVIVVPEFGPMQVIDNVALNFSRNFRTSPYALTGFFRNYVKENSKYDKLIEGEISIYSKGFNLELKKKTSSEIFLNECRTSYSSGIHQKINNKNNLFDLITLSENIHKIIFNRKYSFKVEKYDYHGTDRVIYLAFTRPDSENDAIYSGHLVINERNWGIEQIVYRIFDQNNYNTKTKQSLIDTLKFRHMNEDLVVNYMMIDNHYELSYSRMNYINEFISQNTKVFVSTTTEYLTNNYNSNTRHNGKKLDENGTLINQTSKMPFHPKFWSEYNFLLENSELELVKKDIDDGKFIK